jgi:hypothetical protein
VLQQITEETFAVRGQRDEIHVVSKKMHLLMIPAAGMMRKMRLGNYTVAFV